jgi:hypothetical protein
MQHNDCGVRTFHSRPLQQECSLLAVHDELHGLGSDIAPDCAYDQAAEEEPT